MGPLQKTKKEREGVYLNFSFTKKTPEIIIHGLIKYGGVGVKGLDTLQGISQVKAFIDEEFRV